MKKIECIIQPYNLDDVAAALAVEGVRGMTVTECKGFGVQWGFAPDEEVKPGAYRFHPKMKVEMVVLEEDVDRIMKALLRSLKSNRIGEGKIFILPVDDAVRTRTEERGHAALQ